MEESVTGTGVKVLTITKKEYDRLVENEKILQALEGAGVDNWDGYDYAMESLED